MIRSAAMNLFWSGAAPLLQLVVPRATVHHLVAARPSGAALAPLTSPTQYARTALGSSKLQFWDAQGTLLQRLLRQISTMPW